MKHVVVQEEGHVSSFTQPAPRGRGPGSLLRQCGHRSEPAIRNAPLLGLFYSKPHLIAPVIAKVPAAGVGLMTSLSKSISFYLHNDSVDLNSPKSFGCLHHAFLPAPDCWAALPLITHGFQPQTQGNCLSVRTDISPTGGHFAHPGSTEVGVKVCTDFSSAHSAKSGERRMWYSQITP